MERDTSVATTWNDSIAVPSGAAFYHGELAQAYLRRSDYGRAQLHFTIATGIAANVSVNALDLTDTCEPGWQKPANLVGQAMRALIAGLAELTQLARKRKPAAYINPIADKLAMKAALLIAEACDELRDTQTACGLDPAAIFDNLDVAEHLLGKAS